MWRAAAWPGARAQQSGMGWGHASLQRGSPTIGGELTVLLATTIAIGYAFRYDPGVMDVVVANRIDYGQIDINVPNVGYVALLDCEWLGKTVWLEDTDGKVTGPYLVADCSNGRDRERLKAMGFAVDLSWEVAKTLGVVDRPVGGFVVWDRNPKDVRVGRR